VKLLAEDVWQLDGRPAGMVNVFLLGDVLVDAGTRYDSGRILRQLRDRTVSAHALTHAHPDHLGSSHVVCERLGIPFWVGAGDVPAAEDPAQLAASLRPKALARWRLPPDPVLRFVVFSQAGAGHPVARQLREGDEVAGFQVLEVPGHTAGHIALWRESDRTLIAGDVLWNFQFVMGRPGLTQPAPTSNLDSVQNRASARRLVGLQPRLVCFGHGPPLRDTRKFVDFVHSLPQP
jgi:glyoxylase-like metal-dependent hydrolase (beta-lactamase superfamily II)